MSALVARILLAILMFPLAFCIWFVLMAGLHGLGWGSESALICSSAVTALLAMTYWVLLWRKSVRWRPRRIAQTALAVLGCSLLPLAIVAAIGPPDQGITITLGSASAVTIWVILTVLIWRETPAEKADRIRQAAPDVLFCPKCGYNMTGLHEARCPECGSRFTLDQLVAAQKQDQLGTSA